jgi:shikimate kinase
VTWVVLTGYMGAGKSSVGRRVASRIGRRFVDADVAIESHAELSIPEIFAKRGEVWFRRTEEAVIREVLAESPPGVLALGGGALENARTRRLVNRTANVVWLRVSPAVAWARVEHSDRPLARSEERFTRRAVEREPGYREAAHLVVDADEPLDQIVTRVADWARRTVTDEESP